MFFNSTIFWIDPDWNRRYFEMLEQAKQHTLLENLYPFTSHYWLRFSRDRDLNEAWIPGIIPTVYSKEVPATLGAFYVSYDHRPMGGSFFDTAKQAVDFLSTGLAAEKRPDR